jgi:hypothetical protein
MSREPSNPTCFLYQERSVKASEKSFMCGRLKIGVYYTVRWYLRIKMDGTEVAEAMGRYTAVHLALRVVQPS